jgi:hypothetical protein
MFIVTCTLQKAANDFGIHKTNEQNLIENKTNLSFELCCYNLKISWIKILASKLLLL